MYAYVYIYMCMHVCVRSNHLIQRLKVGKGLKMCVIWCPQPDRSISPSPNPQRWVYSCVQLLHVAGGPYVLVAGSLPKEPSPQP